MVTGWLGRGVANKLARDGASAASTTSSRSGFPRERGNAGRHPSRRGTGSSNPVLSSGESANFRFLSGRRCRASIRLRPRGLLTVRFGCSTFFLKTKVRCLGASLNKDYRRNGQARYRTMTLGAEEFIRRFLLHVLPKGFHRIRHYGLLASANCKTNIARARGLMAAPMPEVDPPAAHDTADPHTTTDYRPPCPCCGGRMIIVEVFARGAAPRGPPPSGTGNQDLMR